MINEDKDFYKAGVEGEVCTKLKSNGHKNCNIMRMETFFF